MKMENLRDLKDVFVVVYAKMATEVPLRSDLVFKIVDLTKKSLLKFKATYADFEKIIGEDEELYAHWLNVEFQVMTLLDGDDSLLIKHSDMIFNTLLGTPGGGGGDMFVAGAKEKVLPTLSRSALIALGFRVFLDCLDVTADESGKPPLPAAAPAVLKPVATRT